MIVLIAVCHETLKNDETETCLCLFSSFYWNGEKMIPTEKVVNAIKQ